jgi:transcriptional regulator with XRE-family HTH domain
MGLGEIIASYRVKRGLTQRELAGLLGATWGAVGHWEAGIRTPSVKTRLLLAEILDIPPDKVLPEVITEPDKVTLVTEPDLLQLVKLYRSLPETQRQPILLATKAFVAMLNETPVPVPG